MTFYGYFHANASSAATVTGLDCASTTSCVAVGTYNTGAGAAADRDPQRDHVGRNSSSATGDRAAAGDAVRRDCISVGACYAVGSYQAKAGAARNGVILTLSGGKRTALKAALWSNANTTQPDVTLSSVACAPGQTRCAAVGSYTHAKGHTTGLMEVLS